MNLKKGLKIAKFGLYSFCGRDPRETRLRTIAEQLSELQKCLKRVTAREHGEPAIDMVVPFFHQMSMWHDRVHLIFEAIHGLDRVNFGQFDKLIEELDSLARHIILSGRDPKGVNRTRRLEPVTDDTVFLGGIQRIELNTVRFFKSKKHDNPPHWSHFCVSHLNAYEIVDRQADKIMSAHEPLIGLIDDIISKC